jgi:hypothetical protein
MFGAGGRKENAPGSGAFAYRSALDQAATVFARWRVVCGTWRRSDTFGQYGSFSGHASYG